MMGTALFDRPAASYAEGLLSYRASALRFSRQDREDLLAYLVKNFGPDAKPRAVRIDRISLRLPRDEPASKSPRMTPLKVHEWRTPRAPRAFHSVSGVKMQISSVSSRFPLSIMEAG